MPFLSEEEVTDLHKKIDVLEESRVSLDKLNEGYRKQIKQKETKLRGIIAALVLVSLGLIGVVLAVFVFNPKQSNQVVQQPKIVRDTIYVEKQVFKELVPEIDTNAITYGVQIGAYRKFNASFDTCVQKVVDNNTNYYVLGSFETEVEAEDLKTLLEGLKLKGAVVVKMQHGALVK